MEWAEDRVAGQVGVRERSPRQRFRTDHRGGDPDGRPGDHHHADGGPHGERIGRRSRRKQREQQGEGEGQDRRRPPHEPRIGGRSLAIRADETAHRLIHPFQLGPAAQQPRKGGGRGENQRQCTASKGCAPGGEALGRGAVGSDQHRHAADGTIDGDPAALAHRAPVLRIGRDAQDRLRADNRCSDTAGQPIHHRLGRHEAQTNGSVQRGNTPAAGGKLDPQKVQRIEELLQQRRCGPPFRRQVAPARAGISAIDARQRPATCRTAPLRKAHGPRPPASGPSRNAPIKAISRN